MQTFSFPPKLYTLKGKTVSEGAFINNKLNNNIMSLWYYQTNNPAMLREKKKMLHKLSFIYKFKRSQIEFAVVVWIFIQGWIALKTGSWQ